MTEPGLPAADRLFGPVMSWTIVTGIFAWLPLDHASRGALDLTEPDPIPEYEFDQSIPDDFDS